MENLKVNPFPVVQANSLATTQFIPDRPLSLYGLVLILGGGNPAFSAALIDRVTVKSGAKELYRLTGARLNTLNLYDGLTDDTAYLPIPFADPTARTARGEHLGMLDMTVYTDPITIEVLIGNVLVSAPTLEARALITVPKGELEFGYDADEIQTHRALIESVIQPSAAVNRKAFGISLGSEAGALIRKIAFFNANMTQLAVKRNGFDIYDDVDVALNNYIADDMFARNPQAGLFVYDPTVNGNQSDAKRTVNKDGKPANYQLLVSTSAGDTITVYSDVYSKIPLL